MTSQAYGIVALLMRYIFLLLGALIAVRAFIWLWREHAAYMKQLRKDPELGQIGELTDGKKSWPIYQEGTLGASLACDVVIRKKGLRRRHAGYRLQPKKGLVFAPARGARLIVDGVEVRREAVALDGSVLEAGDAVLRVRLNKALGIPTRTEIIPPSQPEDSEEGWMRLFEEGTQPDLSDPLNPMNDSGFPGFPQDGPDADAFLPDRPEDKQP